MKYFKTMGATLVVLFIAATAWSGPMSEVGQSLGDPNADLQAIVADHSQAYADARAELEAAQAKHDAAAAALDEANANLSAAMRNEESGLLDQIETAIQAMYQAAMPAYLRLVHSNDRATAVRMIADRLGVSVEEIDGFLIDPATPGPEEAPAEEPEDAADEAAEPETTAEPEEPAEQPEPEAPATDEPEMSDDEGEAEEDAEGDEGEMDDSESDGEQAA